MTHETWQHSYTTLLMGSLERIQLLELVMDFLKEISLGSNLLIASESSFGQSRMLYNAHNQHCCKNEVQTYLKHGP